VMLPAVMFMSSVIVAFMASMGSVALAVTFMGSGEGLGEGVSRVAGLAVYTRYAASRTAWRDCGRRSKTEKGGRRQKGQQECRGEPKGQA
jgi:hypothetical protein